MDVNSYLGKIMNAKASQGGTLVRPGKYLFEIVKCWFEQGRNSDYFKIELLVRKSESVGKVYGGLAPDGKTPIEVEHEPNAVGTKCSVIIDLRNDSGPGNVKAFGLALANLDERSADPKLFEPGGEFSLFLQQMGNENPNATANGKLIPVQPMTGFLIEDETFTRPIKKGANANKPFTGHNWKHVPREAGNAPEQVATRKAAQVASAAAAQ